MLAEALPQLDLFGTSQTITDEQIDQKDYDPHFVFFLRMRLDKLNLAASALRQAGVVSDADQALDYIESVALRNPFSPSDQPNSRDSRLVRNRPWLRLNRAMGKLDAFPPAVATNNGTVSHSAIVGYLSGKLPRPVDESPEKPRQLAFNPPLTDGQTSFTDQFDWPDPRCLDKFPDAITKSGRVSDRHRSRIEQVWTSAKEDVKDADIWWKKYQGLAPYTTDLTQLLAPIFYEQIPKLKKYPGPLTDYWFIPTLMSWAAMVVTIEQNKRHLFPEVQVGIGGGRIDAVEMDEIDGKPPDPKQSQTLERLSQARYPTVGSLRSQLELHFGPELGIKFVDLKDVLGHRSKREGYPQDFTGPKASDVKQVGRYLVCASLPIALPDGSYITTAAYENASIAYASPICPLKEFPIHIPLSDQVQLMEKGQIQRPDELDQAVHYYDQLIASDIVKNLEAVFP